jgi:hypothetical protein
MSDVTHYITDPFLRELVVSALANAVAEEREACIAIIEKIHPVNNSRDSRWHVEDAVREIKARGKP